MRVVVDANVMVSGLLVGGGPPGRVLDAWIAGAFDLFTSPSLLAELEDVLSRPRIMARISATCSEAFLQQLATQGTLVAPDFVVAAVHRDPDDNRVVEAAVAGKVDVIVSGDDDLLSLGEYEGISIVSPARFLALLEESGLWS